jgi:hypothetical protein
MQELNSCLSLISQIERDLVSPSLDTLVSIVEALEIDIDYLFRELKRKRNVSLVRSSGRNRHTIDGVTYEQLSQIIDAGTGRLGYGAEVYTIGKGDSVSFSSNIPHMLKNRGNSPLDAVWIITPPRLFLAPLKP